MPYVDGRESEVLVNQAIGCREQHFFSPVIDATRLLG